MKFHKAVGCCNTECRLWSKCNKRFPYGFADFHIIYIYNNSDLTRSQHRYIYKKNRFGFITVPIATEWSADEVMGVRSPDSRRNCFSKVGVRSLVSNYRYRPFSPVTTPSRGSQKQVRIQWKGLGSWPPPPEIMFSH